ncbi:MAG TPA: GntR family transcriptional regulator, partial [Pseudolabrys sp.]|nr:GntR family transcriptional regulator [Pseudolabrys sp.]
MTLELHGAEAMPVPLSRSSRQLHSLAYALLKERIISNRYPGGSHILEEQLAADLGISRTPLKEALVNLQAEGLVRMIPRRGVLVVPLTATDVIEIYTVLEALEDLAVRLIGDREDNRADIKVLQDDVAVMQTSLRQDDLDRWAVADEHFHAQLVAASGNSRLIRAAQTLLTQSQRFRLFTLRLRERPVKSTR